MHSGIVFGLAFATQSLEPLGVILWFTVLTLSGFIKFFYLVPALKCYCAA